MLGCVRMGASGAIAPIDYEENLKSFTVDRKFFKSDEFLLRLWLNLQNLESFTVVTN